MTTACGGSHVCINKTRVSWCRDSCTACMGNQVKPCYAQHPTVPRQPAPKTDAQEVVRWVKILIVLLVAHWALATYGAAVEWNTRGCDAPVAKAVLFGEPGALDACLQEGS